MYLKYPLNTVDFFRAIDCCQGEVLLQTREKDILNLRSQLCRFIFAVAFSPTFTSATLMLKLGSILLSVTLNVVEHSAS